MISKKSALLIMTFVFIASLSAQAEFWYGVNGPEQLHVDSLKVTLRFSDGFGPNELMERVDRIVQVADDQYVQDRFVVCSLATSTGYDVFLDSLTSLEGVVFAEPYYRTANGTPMLIGVDFCVAFNEEINKNEIDSINTLYGAEISRQLTEVPNVFVLKNTHSSGRRLVELANTYHGLSETRYAHPDFSAVITTNSYQLHDYYADYQPHTKKVIGQFNQASVWDFAGIDRPVTVALVDDGLAAHEDLDTERMLAGIDVARNGTATPGYDGDPSPGDGGAHAGGRSSSARHGLRRYYCRISHD